MILKSLAETRGNVFGLRAICDQGVVGGAGSGDGDRVLRLRHA